LLARDFAGNPLNATSFENGYPFENMGLTASTLFLWTKLSLGNHFVGINFGGNHLELSSPLCYGAS